MKKRKTNLGKSVLVCESIEDMKKQFDEDVYQWGKELLPIMNHFNMGVVYDQLVVAAILCNYLAMLTVEAEKSDPYFSETVIKSYQQNLKEFRKIGDKLFIRTPIKK